MVCTFLEGNTIFVYLLFVCNIWFFQAQSAEAVEYTDCVFAEG